MENHNRILIKVFKPCTECEGFGRIRVLVYQDESRYDDCAVCDGLGLDAFYMDLDAWHGKRHQKEINSEANSE